MLYLFIAVFCYLITLGGRTLKGNRIILCYHGISKEQRERFRLQMSKITDNASVIDKCERKQLSRKICITFDDAFENLLENVLPLLNELRIPAIVFAVPGNLGQSPKWNIAPDHPEYNEKTMTIEQLKSIQNDLITIGSHTQTHPDLSKLPPDQMQWELIESKKNLEQLIDKPIDDLALPHGAYNQDVLRIAEEIGYKRVYTLEPKLGRANQKTGAIGRFSMSPDVWPIEFYLTCCGAYCWLFPFRTAMKWIRCKIKGIAQ